MDYKSLWCIGIALAMHGTTHSAQLKDAIDIGVKVNVTANGAVAVTEAPLIVSGTVTLPPKYIAIAGGVLSGIALTKDGIQAACAALTAPPTCTKACTHLASLSDGETNKICPEKQDKCWRFRTPKCHRATSLLLMGGATTATSFLTAYWMGMLT